MYRVNMFHLDGFCEEELHALRCEVHVAGLAGAAGQNHIYVWEDFFPKPPVLSYAVHVVVMVAVMVVAGVEVGNVSQRVFFLSSTS